MVLARLLTQFKKKLDSQPDLFLALELTDETVKSAFWQPAAEGCQVVAYGSVEEWQKDQPDSLLKAVDRSLTNASEKLPSSPQGVIFGLPEHWLDKNQILPDKKSLLRLVSQKFGLKPLGFVESQQALLHYLKLKEGTPLNTLFIRVGFENVEVVLVKFGQIQQRQTVARTDDLAKDVAQALLRFKNTQPLPSQMLLFNSQAISDEAKQQLTSYPWQEEFSFLHLPKIEDLPPHFTVEAIAVAGGSEVARSLQLTPPPAPTPSAASLGFVQQKDVHLLKSSPSSSPSPKPATVSPAPQPPSSSQTPSSLLSLSRLTAFLSLFARSLFKLPRRLFSRLPLSSRPSFLLVGLGLCFLLAAAGLFAAWWFLPKAQVTVFVRPETLQKELTLSLDPNLSSPDWENHRLPAQPLTLSLKDSASAPTTGEKLVGDPATGEVIIYNKTDLTKTFKAGTKLVGPQNLTFALDEDVTVASQSSEEKEEGIVTTFGKATAKVTALFIGPEGNLPAGTELTFKDYPPSVYAAKTETGFTGGTSRQVRVVSEEDQQNLLSQLTDKLRQLARQQLAQQLSANQTLLEDHLLFQVESQDFDHAVGDEADSLTLSLSATVTALAYSQDDLNQLLTQLISQDLSGGFVLYQPASQLEVTDVTFDEDQLTAQLTLRFSAQLIPDLDPDTIKQNIKGRYPPVAQAYLETLPNFVEAEILISPSLPARLRTLPHQPKNIQIEIKTTGS